VRALERALGADLFTRTANRSELTDAGRRLWGHVAAGFATIETGIGELATASETFVLAAHPGIAQQWLVPRIDGLRAAIGERELRCASSTATTSSHTASTTHRSASATARFPASRLACCSPRSSSRWPRPTSPHEYGLDGTEPPVGAPARPARAHGRR
jgi:hypothetical protein